MSDTIRITDLIENPKNANKGTERGMDELRKSVDRIGYTDPGVISQDNVILAGNHRNKVAEERGDEPVIIDSDGTRPIFVRLPIKSGTKEAAMVSLLSNRVAALNQNIDEHDVRTEIEALEIDPEEVGYQAVELGMDEIPAAVESAFEQDGPAGESDAKPEPKSDPFVEQPADVPPTKAVSRCQAGDLWKIGNHRLLIGDCRDFIQLGRLVGDTLADIAITSPPYADQRAYDEESGFKPIKSSEYVEWFKLVHIGVMAVLKSDGSFFVNIKPHVEDKSRSLYVMDLVQSMVAYGWSLTDEFAWVRRSNPGRWPNRLRNDFEPVYHFAKSTPRVRHDNIAYQITDPHGRGGEQDPLADHWNRPDPADMTVGYPGNVIQVGVEGHGTGHTAVFPVRLPLFFINAFTDKGSVVLDPFIGAGTTMVACEQSERICFGMEISAKHGDIILERMRERCGVDGKLLERL